ncbi:MAG: DUF1854 domain-containing protein [Burkholderiaceae bacterium]|jgi:hypothetical protein
MNDLPSETLDFALHRDARGRLVCVRGGTTHVGVQPVRPFPVTAPEWSCALLDNHGHEICWIDDLAGLPPATARLVEEALASRTFTPNITALLAVSTFSTPSVWTVDTDRGRTRFVLKSEESIRRLSGDALLIADAHGVQYWVADRFALDRSSRKLLERFL